VLVVLVQHQYQLREQMEAIRYSQQLHQQAVVVAVVLGQGFEWVSLVVQVVVHAITQLLAEQVLPIKDIMALPRVVQRQAAAVAVLAERVHHQRRVTVQQVGQAATVFHQASMVQQ
jgi:hypothetical protein